MRRSLHQRIWGLILSALIGLGLLAGCGQTESADAREMSETRGPSDAGADKGTCRDSAAGAGRDTRRDSAAGAGRCPRARTSPGGSDRPLGAGVL